jgi:TonB family protein
MLPSYFSLRANLAERLMPANAAPNARSGLYVALLCAGIVHAGVLAFLLVDYRQGAAAAPETVEIPVEIIVEPPPPTPQPAPPEKAEQPPPPIDLKPAYDAPRAENQEIVEREAPDATSKAPPVKAAGSTPPAAREVRPAQQGDPRAPAVSPAPMADKPADEILPAPQPDSDKSVQKLARAEIKAEPQTRSVFPGEKFPTFDSVPDVDFGSAAKATPIDGGKAKSTYLTVLYGKIMAHMRVPAPRGNPTAVKGAVVFVVDGLGNLTQRKISKSSGRQELDSAALDAVGQAAPFPPPPTGAPIGLTFAFSAQ